MKVSAQYAEEHLEDLFDTADSGEEVLIARPNDSSYRLVLVEKKVTSQRGRRILGAGVGELHIPSWEEWKSMDQVIEQEMNDSTLLGTNDR